MRIRTRVRAGTARPWAGRGRRELRGTDTALVPQACPKVRQILDIWASGRGVVSLHCFQHVVAVEAYTREACLVDALGGCLSHGVGFTGRALDVPFPSPLPSKGCLFNE